MYDIVTIHQPSYWPWLGLLDKIAKADLYVFLDNVLVSKGSFQYRNIFNCEGKALFITLPVEIHIHQTINELKFKNNDWKTTHIEKLKNYYRRAPFFKEIYDSIAAVYEQDYEKPVDLLFETMAKSMQLLDIKTQIIRNSSLPSTGNKGDLVFDICKIVNAQKYLAGRGSYQYMQDVKDKFSDHRIEIIWQNFQHPVYLQYPNSVFLEGLSCLDLLFFNGIEGSREIFWNNIKNEKL